MNRIKPRLPLLAAALLSLSGCVTAGSDPGVCPVPVVYSRDQQARAADELEALPPGSALALMIEDYGRERARLRACERRS